MNKQGKIIGEVISVCVSDKKGVQKTPVGEITLIADLGIEGDAHAERGIKRQVSLLADESADKMRAKGIAVGPGAFAENILTRGVELPVLPLGTMLLIGKTLLKVSQIGKVCHDRCHIYQTVGDCVMPREGIFVQVVEGGRIQPGDKIFEVGSEP